MVCGWDGDIPEGAIVIEGDVVCKSITADLIYVTGEIAEGGDE